MYTYILCTYYNHTSRHIKSRALTHAYMHTGTYIHIPHITIYRSYKLQITILSYIHTHTHTHYIYKYAYTYIGNMHAYYKILQTYIHI